MKVLRPARRRMAAWGAAAAFLYVATAVASVSLGLVHGRTLYDGLPAQPYRWITPPLQRVRDNQKPDSIDTTTNINDTGLPDPQSVSTGDLQATVIFEKVDPKEYAPDKPTDMKVRITPLDPTTVGPRPAGRYFDSRVGFFTVGFDDYGTNLPLEACDDRDVLLTYKWNGKPLAKEHGGPVRVIVPKRYAWKGAKWVKEITFSDKDEKGFWEVRGYSNSAFPWENDRYG